MTIYSRTDFLWKLNLIEYSMELSENTIAIQTYGGDLITSTVGTSIWHGTITVNSNNHDVLKQKLALVRVIQRPGNYFTFSPYGHFYPIADKNGTIIKAHTTPVTVASGVDAGYSLPLQGLPSEYVLSTGDYLTVPIGSVGRLYQIAEDATAGTNGKATVKLVNPITATGVPDVGTTVTISMPYVTCKYIPNSLKIGTISPGYADGFSFEFMQVLSVT